jgi:hypothetical protein
MALAVALGIARGYTPSSPNVSSESRRPETPFVQVALVAINTPLLRCE